jgi:2-polyprenyl-3-methyl-5-hydroxy-6-metoxy-1,4-benzoquinol methylase
MAIDGSILVALNRAQVVSEQDTFTTHRYRQFARNLSKNTVDILDIGCNSGRGGYLLKAYLPSSKITGLDCVSDRLSRVDPEVYHETLCSFTTSIDLPSGTFDAIVAGEFIEHLPSCDVFPSLCEFFRLLRLRGLLLLTTPNPYYIRNFLRGSSVLLDPAHLSQHAARSLRRRLEDVGFSRIRVKGSGHVSRIIGQYSPLRVLYGSYLIKAVKW